MDVIAGVKHSTENTRMACQIYITEELNNLTIRVPNKRQAPKGARKFMGEE
jgi:hypothetical protein